LQAFPRQASQKSAHASMPLDLHQCGRDALKNWRDWAEPVSGM
jgi:hypothetical protein